MSQHQEIMQLGLSGKAAEVTRSVIALPDYPGHLGAVATASLSAVPEGMTFQNLEGVEDPGLEGVKIMTIEDALATKPRTVISNLRYEAAQKYEPLFAKQGAKVFTTAEPNRIARTSALVIPNLGMLDMEKYLKSRKNRGGIIASPGGVSTLIAIIIEQLDKDPNNEVTNIGFETLQGTSSAGSYYDFSKSKDPIRPTNNNDSKEIQDEVTRLLEKEDIPRFSSVKETTFGEFEDGHYINLEIALKKSISAKRVKKLLEEARSPNFVRLLGGSKKPIVVLNKDLVVSDPESLVLPDPRLVQKIDKKPTKMYVKIVGDGKIVDLSIFGSNQWAILNNAYNAGYAQLAGLTR